MRLPLWIVAAVARNGVLGDDGRLPWRLPSDLARFKALTMGKPLLMGSRTWRSIGRPLPGRETIVLTRDRGFAAPGAHVAHELAAALDLADAVGRRLGSPAVVVAGGGDVYAQTIALAARLAITEVDLAPVGDAVFPPIDLAIWREAARAAPARGPNDEAPFTFVDYARF